MPERTLALQGKRVNTMSATVTFDFSAVNRSINGRIGPRTREAWLGRVANALRPRLLSAGGTLPEKIRYSTGWPGGSRGTSKKAIGQCFYPQASADGTVEIFISPVLGDGPKAADTLAHELVHACLDIDAGHGPRFKKLALAFGLEGKMKEAGAGPELMAHILEIIDAIGPYPHAELGTGEAADKPKKQNTRQCRVTCPECRDDDTGKALYIVRMSQSTIDIGLPTCPCGAEMVQDAPEDGEEG